MERISQNRDSAVHYYVADGQGSIRGLTDTAGNVTDVYYYSAFGEEVAKSGVTENEFRYVGEQWDPNAGFYYLRARWMDPSSGRFVSVDPYEGDPQAPVSLHCYLYGNAAPISVSDPSGQFSIMEFGASLGVRATLFVLNHKRVMFALGLLANLMIPEEVQLSLMGSGNPIGVTIGATGQAEVKVFQLIKNKFLMNLIKSHNSLAGRFWNEYGHSFENCVRKYLLNNASGPIKLGNTNFSVDAEWNRMFIEVKSGGIGVKQLAAIAEFSKDQGRSFAYIFLRKPSRSEIKKINKAGGTAFYLFEE